MDLIEKFNEQFYYPPNDIDNNVFGKSKYLKFFYAKKVIIPSINHLKFSFLFDVALPLLILCVSLLLIAFLSSVRHELKNGDLGLLFGFIAFSILALTLIYISFIAISSGYDKRKQLIETKQYINDATEFNQLIDRAKLENRKLFDNLTKLNLTVGEFKTIDYTELIVPNMLELYKKQWYKDAVKNDFIKEIELLFKELEFINHNSDENYVGFWGELIIDSHYKHISLYREYKTIIELYNNKRLIPGEWLKLIPEIRKSLKNEIIAKNKNNFSIIE